jgi:hypothetical protein
VQITDASGKKFPIKIENLFKAFPGNHTVLTTNSMGAGASYGFKPYDGGWFIAVSLVDENDLPLGLSPGDAKISITSTILTTPETPIPGEGDIRNLTLKILDQPAVEYNSDYVSQFSYYDDSPSTFIVRPDSTPEPDLLVHGLKISIDIDSIINTGDQQPITSQLGSNPYIQNSSWVEINDDNTSTFHAMILCPDGYVDPEDIGPTNANINDLIISILHSGFSAEEAISRFSLNLENSYYIDDNGDRIDGIFPIMNHRSEL